MEWAISVEQGHWAYSDLWCTLSVGVSICLIAWLVSKQAKVSVADSHGHSTTISLKSDEAKRVPSLCEKT
jgi:hypothetical protein